MSRIRSIKPESCISETLAEVSDRACLLFAYLPCFCDDEGRMQYSPRLVKAQLFPMRDQITPDDCEALVAELAEHGLVIVYEAAGKRVLQVTNFLEHQHPQRPKPSEFPPPPAFLRGADAVQVADGCRTDAGQVEDGSRTDAVQVAEGREEGALPAETPDTEPDKDESRTNAVRVRDESGTGIGCRVIGEESNRRVMGEESRGGEGRAAPGPRSSEDVRQIVAYLNRKTGKNFKHSTAKTRRDVQARLREGFTVEDFKRVIDVKCAQWGGDRKMAGYLRPETLFGTKFEGYLNEQPPGGARQEGGRYAVYN